MRSYGAFVGALVITTGAAVADTLVFEGFSDTSLLTLNGAATTVSTADGVVLRVTPAAGSQSGSVFSSAQVDASTFSTMFEFRITEPGGTIFDCNTESGADGIVFVVQSVSSSIGGVGQGIGYSGIPSSVGVEFDTWCNAANNDPSSNHVGVDTNGSVNHGAGAPFTTDVSPRFDDENRWYVWIDYDGGVLEVRANQTGFRPDAPLLTRDLDIPTIINSSTAYVGFTSGTGADWGNHDIIRWEYDLFTPGCAADLNDDGTVNARDLAIQLAAFGDCPAGCLGDLDSDFDVDLDDQAILLGNWGPCPK